MSSGSLLGKLLSPLGGPHPLRAGSNMPVHIAIIGTGGGAMAAEWQFGDTF